MKRSWHSVCSKQLRRECFQKHSPETFENTVVHRKRLQLDSGNWWRQDTAATAKTARRAKQRRGEKSRRVRCMSSLMKHVSLTATHSDALRKASFITKLVRCGKRGILDACFRVRLFRRVVVYGQEALDCRMPWPFLKFLDNRRHLLFADHAGPLELLRWQGARSTLQDLPSVSLTPSCSAISKTAAARLLFWSTTTCWATKRFLVLGPAHRSTLPPAEADARLSSNRSNPKTLNCC